MAIADLTCDKIGSHFPIWPPSSLGKRGFVWENCGTYLFSVDFDLLWGPYYESDGCGRYNLGYFDESKMAAISLKWL